MKKKLLVVDDEENILIGIKRYFGSAGYDVDCAGEREEAEALVGHVRYDCVIVDLCLTPAYGADGLGVITSIRDCCPSTRILVLSAFGSKMTKDEAFRLGADAFLQKPQALSEVRKTIDALVESE